MSDNSDDDLLNGKAHVSEKIVETDKIINEFSELDSDSQVLPVPPGLRGQIAPSKTNPYIHISPIDVSEDSLEFATADDSKQSDREKQQNFDNQQLQKLGQYQTGDLDTVTEHLDQEDLMS